MEVVEILNHIKDIASQVIGRKVPWSNFYGIDFENVVAYKEGDSVVFQKFFEDYSRIYISGSNEPEIVSILSSLGGICILNIPTKTNVDIWKDLLDKSGFKPLAVYSRYVNTAFTKWASNTGLSFATPSDVDLIESQLKNTFSRYLAHLPNKIKLLEMINNKVIVVDRDKDGRVVGAVGFPFKGKTGDLPFWYNINKDGKGLRLLFNAYFALRENGVVRITNWVDDTNEISFKTHMALGAKPDGMKDYIFIKQQYGRTYKNA